MPARTQFAVVLASLLVVCSVPAQVPGAGASVRILRDPWGVPHVLSSDSDRGAFYGYGWALAEDQLEAVLSALWTAQGRRTEIDGERALAIDRAHRLLRVTGDVERRWDELPADVRALAAAFADGINAYMRAHPDRVPEWAEPVRPSWPMGLGRMIAFLPQVRLANREAGDLAPRLATISSGANDRHYTGSNAWAVAPKRMRDGASTVLVTDPHLPWKNEFRLYEVHMRGATFEVAGAAFIGVPLPAFGRNGSVAWGWTWNGPDHADVYRLTLDPKDPGRNLLDGRSVAFERERAEFAIAGGGAREETLYWSVHGPVTHRDVERGFAVAYRLSAFGQIGAAQQFFDLVRARDLDAVDRAMTRLQVPHFNLVAADLGGSIEYVWGGRVPRRRAGVDASRPLDGSRSDTLWATDDVVPYSDMPRVRDPEIGFVQSCNNHPHRTTATKADPAADSYPPGVVVHGEEDTLRAWYLRRRLHEAGDLTIEQARALATDGYMIPHAAMTAQLRRAWALVGEAFAQRDEIAGEVELLLRWDGMPQRLSGAPTLFTAWLYEYGKGRIFLPVAMLEREPAAIDAADARAMLVALVAAKGRLRALVPAPRIPWGVVHVIRRGRSVFPVETGMYPAISLMNANLELKLDGGQLPTCRIGSAYVAMHELRGSIRSWSILPLGQTDDPELPYRNAMTRLFARRKLKPLPFADDELAAVKTVETVLQLR